MITVERDNENVVVKFDTDLANNCAGTSHALIPFRWNAVHPYLADTLYRYLCDKLFNKMSHIRQEAYNQGWKDAKSRRTKETCFSGEL